MFSHVFVGSTKNVRMRELIRVVRQTGCMELHHPDGISVGDRGKQLLHSFNDNFPDSYILELKLPETHEYADHQLHFVLHHNKPDKTMNFIQNEINRAYHDTEVTVNSNSVVNVNEYPNLNCKTTVQINAKDLNLSGAHMKIYSAVEKVRQRFA
jgi:hypothetical protein